VNRHDEAQLYLIDKRNAHFQLDLFVAWPQ